MVGWHHCMQVMSIDDTCASSDGMFLWALGDVVHGIGGPSGGSFLRGMIGGVRQVHQSSAVLLGTVCGHVSLFCYAVQHIFSAGLDLCTCCVVSCQGWQAIWRLWDFVNMICLTCPFHLCINSYLEEMVIVHQSQLIVMLSKHACYCLDSLNHCINWKFIYLWSSDTLGERLPLLLVAPFLWLKGRNLECRMLLRTRFLPCPSICLSWQT